MFLNNNKKNQMEPEELLYTLVSLLTSNCHAYDFWEPGSRGLKTPSQNVLILGQNVTRGKAKGCWGTARMGGTNGRWPGTLPSALEPRPKGFRSVLADQRPLRAQGRCLLFRSFSAGHPRLTSGRGVRAACGGDSESTSAHRTCLL